MIKKTYRVDELAKDWDCSRKTIERQIKRGNLEAFKVGSSWRVKHEEAERYRSTHASLPRVVRKPHRPTCKLFGDDSASNAIDLIDAMGDAYRTYNGLDFRLLTGPIVYAWIHSGKIFYVGKSARGIGRALNLSHHRLNGFEDNDQILIWCIASNDSAERIEKDLIKRFRPVKNRYAEIA